MFKDKLFLLSTCDVVKYLPTKESRRCKFLFHYVGWILRSPGDDTCYATFVDVVGSLNRTGGYISYPNFAVRPAMHLNPTHLKYLERTDKDCVIFANIEWIVLDEKRGLLLSQISGSRYCFDAECNDYEHSEIRAYLNGELLNELFTEDEQKLIMDTVIDGEESHPANLTEGADAKKLICFVTNDGTIEISQSEVDGPVTMHRYHDFNDFSETKNDIIIPNDEMVQLLNLYQHIKDKDIQNDFINPYGKNH